MNRREFVRLTGSGMTAGAIADRLVSTQVAAQPAVKKTGKALMKAGTQHGDSDPILRAMAGFGVNHICSRLPVARPWTTRGRSRRLTRLRERVESFGLTLDMVPLPLSSSEISRSESPAILLAKEPDRDKQIDDICQMIRNTGKAGIPSLKYNLTFLGVPRSAPDGRPRQGAVQHVRLRRRQAGSAAHRSRPVSTPTRIGSASPISSSASCRSRRSPRSGSRAIRRIPACRAGKASAASRRCSGRVDGLKRFVSITESPYHGLNFCQGTVSEMLEKPGEQIFDVIRYFGTRKKIFNVHFRNIAGGFLNFRETFIDDGDVDMLKAMRVYKEVGYDGMMMPDHVPHDRGRRRQRFRGSRSPSGTSRRSSRRSRPKPDSCSAGLQASPRPTEGRHVPSCPEVTCHSSQVSRKPPLIAGPLSIRPRQRAAHPAAGHSPYPKEPEGMKKIILAMIVLCALASGAPTYAHAAHAAFEPAAAQQTTGNISGRIVDAQGAAMPGVTVTGRDTRHRLRPHRRVRRRRALSAVGAAGRHLRRDRGAVGVQRPSIARASSSTSRRRPTSTSS